MKGWEGCWQACKTKPGGVDRMSGDAGAFPMCVEGTQMTPDNTTLQVRSSGYGRAVIGRSSREDINTGRH